MTADSTDLDSLAGTAECVMSHLQSPPAVCQASLPPPPPADDNDTASQDPPTEIHHVFRHPTCMALIPCTSGPLRRCRKLSLMMYSDISMPVSAPLHASTALPAPGAREMGCQPHGEDKRHGARPAQPLGSAGRHIGPVLPRGYGAIGVHHTSRPPPKAPHRPLHWTHPPAMCHQWTPHLPSWCDLPCSLTRRPAFHHQAHHRGRPVPPHGHRLPLHPPPPCGLSWQTPCPCPGPLVCALPPLLCLAPTVAVTVCDDDYTKLLHEFPQNTAPTFSATTPVHGNYHHSPTTSHPV